MFNHHQIFSSELFPATTSTWSNSADLLSVSIGISFSASLSAFLVSLLWRNIPSMKTAQKRQSKTVFTV